MKSISAAAVLLLGAAPRARRPSMTSRAMAGIPTTSLPTGWATTSKRYSPLNQVNRKTVKRLVPVVEPESRQQLGRAGAADRLQRRDVRDQRQGDRGDRSRPPAGSSGSTRSTGRPRTPRVVCCAGLQQGRAIYKRQGLSHHAGCSRACARRERTARRSGNRSRRIGRTAFP